jgi:hypothetical protein
MRSCGSPQIQGVVLRAESASAGVFGQFVIYPLPSTQCTRPEGQYDYDGDVAPYLGNGFLDCIIAWHVLRA